MAGKPIHGYFGTRYYNIAGGAFDRCNNAKSKDWHKYGGRGIRFKFDSLVEMAKYIESLPGANDRSLSIDRIDRNGHYERGNLRWATNSEQNRNRSIEKLLTVRGTTKPLIVWCEELGLRYGTVDMRLRRGWSAEEAVEVKIQPFRKAGSQAIKTLRREK